MSESYPKLRVAAVQAAPAFLDREATVRKACDLILEAGAGGARFIVFPECFIPGYPHWFEFYAAGDPICQRCNGELFANSVEVPSPATERLGTAAREAGAYVVMGINERRPEILGTMYNVQLFFGPDGRLIRRRRKLMPTLSERLVHGMGDGRDLTALEGEFGPMGGLICGENGNPLFKYVVAAQGVRLHGGAWPAKMSASYARGVPGMVLRAQACAMEGNHFGVHAAGIFTNEMADLLELRPEARRGLLPGGGSVVVGPSGEVIAGPAGGEETILYADVDLGEIVAAKLRQDFTGHYNRFDVIRVTLDTTPNLPLRVVAAPEGGAGEAAVPGAPDLPSGAEVWPPEPARVPASARFEAGRY